MKKEIMEQMTIGEEPLRMMKPRQAEKSCKSTNQNSKDCIQRKRGAIEEQVKIQATT